MELLNGILIALYQGALLFIIAKIILDIKYSKKEFLIILLINIFGSLFYLIVGRYALFIIILLAVIYFFNKIKIYTFLTMVGSVLILYLGNLSAMSSFLLISDDILYSDAIINTLYIFLFTVTSILLSVFVRFLLKKLKKSYLSTNNIYITTIAVFLLVSFVLPFIFMPYSVDNPKTFKLVITAYIAFIFAMVIFVIILSFTILREMRNKRQIEEIDNYYKYTLRIEKINNDMRKFRHDYVNILLSMSDYIRNDDMDGLKAYFDENIVPLKDNIQTNSFKVNGIERLQVRELKGLLTTKMIQAQENNIRVSVEVPDEIVHISMDLIDLSRMVGIILDNAIEASLEIEDPLIQIGFMKEENSIIIIIMNKCAKDIPKVHELFKDSFSTKGNNRGIGLSTLKEISESKDNVLLDTVIENHYFIQKLEIINTDRKEVK